MRMCAEKNLEHFIKLPVEGGGNGITLNVHLPFAET